MISRPYKILGGLLLAAFLVGFTCLQIQCYKNSRFLSSLKAVAVPGAERSKVQEFIRSSGFEAAPLKENVFFMEIKTRIMTDVQVFLIYNEHKRIKRLDVRDPATESGTKYQRTTFSRW